MKNLTLANDEKICPKCNGTGNVGYRRDFGLCYRCNGFGKIKKSGAKIETATQRRERETKAREDALVAQYRNDPRFQPTKRALDEKYGEFLDGFLYTGDYNTAVQLYKIDHNGKEPE